MLRECEVYGNADVGSGGGVAAVSAYMGGTRCSGVLSSACGVCDICMFLALGGVGGVRGEIIGFGLYQSWRNMGKVGCVCFGFGGVGGVGGGGGLGPGGMVVLCRCVL